MVTDNTSRYKESINEYDKAMRSYNRVIFFNKRSALAYWRRGDLHSRNKDYQKAINDFTKSISIDSAFNGGYTYWDRAFCKEQLKDFDGALKDYNSALQISPEKENFYFFRATLRYRMNDEDGALVDLDSAIKFWDSYELARMWRGFILTKRGEYQRAMIDYGRCNLNESDENDPSYATDFLYRGISRYETGDKDGACVDWTVAAKFDTLAVQQLQKHCR
jgi:tetratricopeptide (TPR) repeat protein